MLNSDRLKRKDPTTEKRTERKKERNEGGHICLIIRLGDYRYRDEEHDIHKHSRTDTNKVR